MTDYERLETLCKILDFESMRAFARAAGLNVQTFYDIQAGRCKMSKRVAEAINEKFSNVSISWLLTGEGNMIKTEGNNSQIIGTNSGTAINGSGAVVNPKSEKEDTIAMMQNQINELISQNGKLLNIIDRLTSK